MKLKNLYLIVGLSGSGKDAITNALCEHYDTTKVKSYTTRAQRNEKDKENHIFATDEDYRNAVAENSIIAHTYYDGHDYWATADQVDNADFYVIDTKGADDVYYHYLGKRNVVLLYVDVNVYNRLIRMIKRAKNKADNTIEEIINRSHHDIHELTPFYMSNVEHIAIVDNNGTLEEGIRSAIEMVDNYERALA